MSDDELSGAVSWLFGGHDQGQRDDVLKDKVSRQLHSDHDQALRVLTDIARRYLNPPYTIEDVMAFVDWLDRDLGWA